MFKNFVAYTKRAFTSNLQKTMSEARYFPNSFDDYKVNSGISPQANPQVVKQHIKEIILTINKNFKPSERSSEDLYVGNAGIAYMYYYLSKNPLFTNERDQLLFQAVQYIKPAINVAKYNTRRPSDMPSFLCGYGGVFAVAAAIYSAIGEASEAKQCLKMFQDAGKICKNVRFLTRGSDELFVGRAGYVFGSLWLAKELNIELNMADISEIFRVMVSSGREYAREFNSPCPLMYAYHQKEYLGAAHGVCSILQALLSVPRFLDSNPDIRNEVKTCVDYVLSLQDPEGNFPSSSGKIGQSSKLVHWCHGAGGMVYLMAKAYVVFDEPKYINSCKKMADLIWRKGLLRKGPGICHGVSGNGYVFLLLYRLTKDDMYLHRAQKFYEFMNTDQFQMEASTPDRPYSLYEGIAGQACFLADLTNPNQAHFPFLDVF